jgi:hypothetical protein
VNDKPAATSTAPLVKTVTVPTDAAKAFELFTAHMTRWWPLPTHSVGRGEATAVTMPSEVGAPIVETTADGSRHTWGTLTRWEPPVEVAFTWHPGQPPAAATHVSVRFRQVDGGTEVVLTHEAWEARADGASARDGYDRGWEVVLGRFAELVSSPQAPQAG